MSSDNTKKKYEVWNHISDNGDSISAAPIKELPGGQIYVSLDALDDIIEKELDKRFGPCKKNRADYDNE